MNGHGEAGLGPVVERERESLGLDQHALGTQGLGGGVHIGDDLAPGASLRMILALAVRQPGTLSP